MNRTGKTFEGLLGGHFEGELADDPVAANMAGLRDGEGRLGHATLRHEERQQRRRLRTLSALESINPRELDREQQLDRLALRSHLLHGVEDFERGRHTMDPDAIDAVLEVLFHELQRGDDEPARAAANLRSLLRKAPRFLAEAASLIVHPEPV
ncbi:MAG TPA: DUF885 domain-containing protein, partial [Verrucomicrobiales bacterium]|nr:DUF885 domain-containing protein [Verrucomicrobiales bacterium]